MPPKRKEECPVAEAAMAKTQAVGWGRERGAEEGGRGLGGGRGGGQVKAELRAVANLATAGAQAAQQVARLRQLFRGRHDA